MEPALGHRLLERATFGPRPGEAIADPAEWLEAQLRPPTREPGPEAARRLAALSSLGLEPREVASRLPPRGGTDPEARRIAKREMKRVGREMAGARLIRAVYGERQLLEVMSDFWLNHFNVFARKGPVALLLPHYEREAVRPHALGRFEDLLLAVASSPAMLVYLDAARSTARRRSGRGGLNENYSRELLELHTLGAGGGYDQHDVIEAARTLTGWSLAGRDLPEFRFRPRVHDDGAREVAGIRIRGSGIEQGRVLLRGLARHPSTARHLGRKLACRFVADDPPPALVERLARRHLESEGEIAAVLESLFRSPEFVDPSLRKFKTPLRFAASALRASAADVSSANALLGTLLRLGEAPYLCRPPSGYPDHMAEWLDPGAMLERIQFAFALAFDRIPGARLAAPRSERERLALRFAAPEFQWV